MTRAPRLLIFVFVAAIALIAAAGFGASVAWERYTAFLGPLDLRGVARGLDGRRRSRRQAPAALRDRGRALAPAGHRRDGRSALSGDAARLRGSPLRPPSRHRSGGAAAGRVPVVDARPRRLGRLDPVDAGREAGRAPARRTLEAKLRQMVRAVALERRLGKAGRSISTCRSHPTAVRWRACERRASRISGGSRCG